MKNVLVTGGKGQLATCLKDVTKNLNDFNFIYLDSDELDITDNEKVFFFFSTTPISYCINCAAYTAVDKAESEIVLAQQINVNGAKYLAQACKKYNVVMIHISTDFVFDGKQSEFYKEEDVAISLGVYGKTKLEGEKVIASVMQEHFIIRTSWLYSEYGHNFLKTMLRLGSEREKISVVCNQIGTPTYAGDLALIILKIIVEDIKIFGTYHYSNEGVASWYDFAKAIFDESGLSVNVFPVKTEEYPTLAKRPAFSVMDKSKIKKKLKTIIPYWRSSLIECIKKL